MKKILLTMGVLLSIVGAWAQDATPLTLSESGTRLNRTTAGGWVQGLGSGSPTEASVKAVLGSDIFVSGTGLYWGLGNGDVAFPGDFSMSEANGFSYNGRKNYGGEFVAQVYELTENVASVTTSFSISGSASTSTFSIWRVSNNVAVKLAESVSGWAEGEQTVTVPAADAPVLYKGERLAFIWNSNAGGVQTTISAFSASYTASDDQTSEPVGPLDFLNNNKVYYLKTSRGSLVYNSENANVLCSTKAYSSIDVESEAAQWAIYKYEDRYYLYSVAGGKFVCGTTSGSFPLKDYEAESVTILESTNATYPFAFTFDGKGSIDHFNNQNLPGVAYWGSGVDNKSTDGTAHQIIEAADMPQGMAELIEKKIKKEFHADVVCTLTDDLNNVYTTTVSTLNGAQPEANSITGCTLSDIAWVDDSHKAITAKVAFPFAIAPKATMIKICGGGADGKWYADGTSIKSHHNVQATSANVMNYMWEIAPSFADGALTYTIKNLGNGKYVYSTSADNNHGAGAVTFNETGSPLTCEIASGYFQLKLSTGKYLSVNSPANSAAQTLGTCYPHSGTQITTQVPVYDVTISGVGAATLYTPFAVTIPTGVEAKYIKADGNDLEDAWLTCSTITDGIIPANTAVVLTGAAATYHFGMSGEAGTEISDNLLFGYETATAAEGGDHEGVGAEGTVYALTSNNDKPVFGHYIGTGYTAGKAYLDVAGLKASGARIDFFMLGDGTTDGINCISTAKANDTIYDLSGRRVKSAVKGIYIINGKKVVK